MQPSNPSAGTDTVIGRYPTDTGGCAVNGDIGILVTVKSCITEILEIWNSVKICITEILEI